jgi:hypothetical protein
MDSINRDVEPVLELTPEERAFIAQTLLSVQLRGRSEALRRAIMLIDSIIGKLEEQKEGLSES